MSIFATGKIGNMELRNKIIMTAIHTGFSIEDEITFLQRRAKGGAAAVTAVMGVSGVGAYRNMCVLEESKVDALTKMAEAVHQEDGKLIVQLFHAGRNGSVGMLADPEACPVAPSPVPSPIYKCIPNELSVEEIKSITKEFGHAAGICRKAGVDAVEISCSAGYLLSEFISPLTNRRQDSYGGNLENRLRFPMEVIKGVRKAVGQDYPVILRVSAGDMLGGYGVRDVIQMIRRVENAIDAVNVTGGWHESEIPQISMHLPEGGFALLANEVKKNTVIPVIACNRINNEATAREILEAGYADFVGCARAFLADSDFADKIQRGMPYRRCIGCNKGCIERVLKLETVTCIFNPDVGYEGIENLKKKENKNVLIAGGGPAGMEAAIRFAKGGNRVRLCTEENRLGGLLHDAARAPYKETIRWNIEAMVAELKGLGVKIFINTFVDEDYIEKYNPDLVIVATGSKPIIPKIPGIDRPNVYTAHQILNGDNQLINKILLGKIAIIGGGSVGLETALYLSKKECLYRKSHGFISKFNSEFMEKEKGGIRIFEMGERSGVGLGGLRREMIKELNKFHIEISTNSKVEEIIEDKIYISVKEERKVVAADYVIIALGYQSAGKELADWLKNSEIWDFEVIGDAKEVGTIGKALQEANGI